MLPFQKIDTLSPATHAISIDWGDGNSDFVSGSRTRNLYHVYTQTTAAQRFTIKVQGTFNRLDASNINSSGPLNAITGSNPITSAQLTAARNNFKTNVRKVYLGSSPVSQPSSGAGFNLEDCSGLTHFVSVKGITNTTNLTKFECTFKGCLNLKHIDVRGIDTSNATKLVEMFQLGGKELQADSTAVTFNQTSGIGLDNPANGTLSELETGMLVYAQSATNITPIRNITSITNQSASAATIAWSSSGLSYTDNKKLRFIKPVTGVKMIGLHTFDISSLANSGNNGMNHMLRGVTINSDEVSRCIVAWANNAYGTSPSAASGATNANRLRFDFGQSKFITGEQFSSPTDNSATNIVTDALAVLTGTKNWMASTNFGDPLPIAETGSSNTFDF